ncbi:CAP domain-containing protein [Cohnella abietis]|uniref:LysM domain-containing protein n=1 Tax=Cohnella abietis TaxID=2507935 RepID=A0A3T1DE77_9BACL|nr:CAP domain-containing protein [Cohnella abietis]BBI36402.1 hypothetical protein KCTCHS21_58010 [Cohnella abietis]
MKRIVIIVCLAMLVACSSQNQSQKMKTRSQSQSQPRSQFNVSSVDTKLPYNMHVVQKNESIADIAERYHVDIGDFLRANPDISKNINEPPSSGNEGTKAPQQSADAPLKQDETVKIPANESMTGYESEVLKLTNQERQKAGLAACAGTDSSLNRSARAKSEDMAANNYFSHESPTYGDPFAMMRNFGVQYQSAGENIAKGQPTPQEVVTAWMNSPGHRANIMNGSYTHLGVGYVVKNGEAYWTQQFIGK